MSDADWQAVIARAKTGPDDVRSACCGWPAIPKTSRRGLRFFAHRPGSECQAGEGADHLAVKALVAESLHARGFDVATEYAGPGWRADVYGEHEGRKVAVEVQWSSQTEEETELRTARLEASGLEVLWLERGGLPAIWPEAPVRLELGRDGSVMGGYTVGLGTPSSVPEAVEAWLDLRLSRTPWVPASRHERVAIERYRCADCGAAAEHGPAWLRVTVSERCACGVVDHGADSWEKTERTRALRDSIVEELLHDVPSGLHLDRHGASPKLVTVCPSCGACPRSRPRSTPAVTVVRDAAVPLDREVGEWSPWHWTEGSSGCADRHAEFQRRWRAGYELAPLSNAFITDCRIRCHKCNRWYDGVHAEITVRSRCGEVVAEMSLRDETVGHMLRVAASKGRVKAAPLKWIERNVVVVGWKNVCWRCGALCGEPWLEDFAAASSRKGHGKQVQIDTARWLVPTGARVGYRGHCCQADRPCDPAGQRWRDADD